MFVLVAALILGWLAPASATTLLITNTKSDSISIIDTDTLEVVGTIPVGRGKPNRIVFHPDGKQAWVVFDKSHDLGVVDVEGRKLIKRVKIGGNPYNLTFSPDGRFLYVLDWSSDVSPGGCAVLEHQRGADAVPGPGLPVPRPRNPPRHAAIPHAAGRTRGRRAAHRHRHARRRATPGARRRLRHGNAAHRRRKDPV